MTPASFISSVIGWLRAGYPNGVPENDYVPLFALLSRRLSEDEVKTIATQLIEEGCLPIDKADIQVLITNITDEMPLETDVARIKNHLAESGWAIADPLQSE
jgi:hypothetical protein